VHYSLFFTEPEMTHAYAFVLAGTVLSQARVRVGDVLRTAGPPVRAAARPAKLNADVPQVLGGPIAAGLLLMDGLANIRGWQWMFIVEGSVTVVVGILLKAGPLQTRLHLSLSLHARRACAHPKPSQPDRVNCGARACVRCTRSHRGVPGCMPARPCAAGA